MLPKKCLHYNCSMAQQLGLKERRKHFTYIFSLMSKVVCSIKVYSILTQIHLSVTANSVYAFQAYVVCCHLKKKKKFLCIKQIWCWIANLKRNHYRITVLKYFRTTCLLTSKKFLASFQTSKEAKPLTSYEICSLMINDPFLWYVF